LIILKARFYDLVIRGGIAYMFKKLVVTGAAVLAAAALPASAWFGRGFGFGFGGFGLGLGGWGFGLGWPFWGGLGLGGCGLGFGGCGLGFGGLWW
jgi:hypothetical protein